MDILLLCEQIQGFYNKILKNTSCENCQKEMFFEELNKLNLSLPSLSRVKGTNLFNKKHNDEKWSKVSKTMLSLFI